MNTISIIEASIDDLPIIQEIGRYTFVESFAAVNTPENMRHYLDEAFSVETLSASLLQSAIKYYLAKDDEQTIGYLKLNMSQAQNELKDENCLEIERIYITKAYHGQHVGQLLLEKAIEVAQAHHCDFVWLGVWEENPRAISFYKKNGFVEFGNHVFMLGNDAQTDILMKLPLKN